MYPFMVHLRILLGHFLGKCELIAMETCSMWESGWWMMIPNDTFLRESNQPVVTVTSWWISPFTQCLISWFLLQEISPILVKLKPPDWIQIGDILNAGEFILCQCPQFDGSKMSTIGDLWQPHRSPNQGPELCSKALSEGAPVVVSGLGRFFELKSLAAGYPNSWVAYIFNR